MATAAGSASAWSLCCKAAKASSMIMLSAITVFLVPSFPENSWKVFSGSEQVQDYWLLLTRVSRLTGCWDDVGGELAKIGREAESIFSADH